MKKAKLAALSLTGLIGCALLGAFASLACSEIETTPSGVHRRLLVPLLGLATAKIAMPAGTADTPALDSFLDGPVVKVGIKGAWAATWFCDNRVHSSGGTTAELTIDCAGRRHSFQLKEDQSQMAASSFAMPARLLVLSDIEGNIGYLNQALQNLEVVDSSGRWRFGANQVVIAGDAVDRGRDVFAVLWRLHDLSRQARAAGGQLHFVLGNHEQYILRGNTSRAHPDHLHALARMGGHEAAFAADTVLGNWMRRQPVVLKVGKVLIAHGGISPAVLKHRLSLEQINDGMLRYWRGEGASNAQLDAVLAPSGVTQYRGYLEPVDDQYGMATAGDVEAVARTFGVKHIVVGHTIVEKVTGLYGNQVYAIDVNSNTAATEALMFVDGVPQIVDTRAPRRLPDAQVGAARPINLLSASDWNTLSRNAVRSWELSRIPHPY